MDNATMVVSNGVRMLDTHFGVGAWAGRINLSELNIRDPFACVLGQLFGAFSKGVDAITPTGERGRGDWAAYHGFDGGYAGEVAYDALTEEWKRQIVDIRS